MIERTEIADSLAAGAAALDLSEVGITNAARIARNLATPLLYEEAIRREEGLVSHLGPFVVRTGQYTGRSASDKFFVREASSEKRIDWGKVNRPFLPEDFDRLLARLQAYLQGRTVYVQDCYAGADPAYRLRLRVISESAWHSMFARDMFIRELDPAVLRTFAPEWTIIHCPNMRADPHSDGTRSEVFIVLHFGRRLILIGGTSYAGEMKKSVFTVLNYVLPLRGVLSMHCSANQGPNGDVALFFGLSGTGKTTLSSDPHRALIGDDEHGWSDHGVFNFEGGCYAKVVNLSAEAEPEIWQAARRFGTILENVVTDAETRRMDFNDASLTENTRAAYPLTHLANIVPDGMGDHPTHVFFLTADAFGVLPPVARLSPAQAMYHFLSGYTAKVAGTERGVREPQATFSACFGAPFMPLHPTVYAKLLGEKLARHDVQCWLLNTGWTGGPYGVGRRMRIQHSRAILRAVLRGDLERLEPGEYRVDPVFGFEVPRTIPYAARSTVLTTTPVSEALTAPVSERPAADSEVPRELLDPRRTWADGEAYDAAANRLAELFHANFAAYAERVPADVRAAGPRVLAAV